MKKIREISRVTKGRPAIDGAGVHLVRVVGFHDTLDYDPFLLLDAFDSTNPEDYTKGFPWHPHRGIETITYLIEGEIDHGDSLGNAGKIKAGDCQWMTAGSGIIHQEMPQPSKRLLGAQLWLNMPKADKMKDPKYGDILHENVPVIREDNVTIKIIAGKYKETKGAFEGDYVKATYLDVELKGNQKWELSTENDYTLFIYLISGEVIFGTKSIREKNAVLFETGDLFQITATNHGARFLLFYGKPLKEPIAWGGHIVMNTREELRQAFADLDNNTFIKKNI